MAIGCSARSSGLTALSAIRRHAIRIALTLLLAAQAGCETEVTVGPTPFLVDLRVLWNIDGSTSPALCNSFAIDAWLVEVRGPENADIFVDCFDFWSTGSALVALPEGFYAVTVRAVDFRDLTIAAISTDADLFDRGFIEELIFNFTALDFL